MFRDGRNHGNQRRRNDDHTSSDSEGIAVRLWTKWVQEAKARGDRISSDDEFDEKNCESETDWTIYWI